jgi:hypothetical protein
VCEFEKETAVHGLENFKRLKMSALKPDGLQSHATTPRKGRQDGKTAALEASTAATNSPELALSQAGPHMKDEVKDARRQASLSARNCTQ